MADDCIFCKIVAGELPATKVDEDERTLAFMDIAPWTRGHALVIPKAHARRPRGDRRRRPRGVRGRPPSRIAAAPEGAARRRGRQPAQLLRRGRVADGLPLPRPRHPALRRRRHAGRPRAPAPAATRTRSRRPAELLRMTAFGPWTLEQDGAARRPDHRQAAAEPVRPEVDAGPARRGRPPDGRAAARPAAARRGPGLDRRRRRQPLRRPATPRAAPSCGSAASSSSTSSRTCRARWSSPPTRCA